jgi:hypothetical protein
MLLDDFCFYENNDEEKQLVKLVYTKAIKEASNQVPEYIKSLLMYIFVRQAY